MKGGEKNCYSLLNVQRTAEAKEIKKAYRKIVLIAHPDKGGTDELFQKVQESYDILSDSLKRKQYDMDLKRSSNTDGIHTANFYNWEAVKVAAAERLEKLERANTGSTKNLFKKKVEIPTNPASLSVKKLKELLNDLGINHENCVEKSELVDKVIDYMDKTGKRRSTGPERAFSPAGPGTKSSSKFPPPPPEPSKPPPKARGGGGRTAEGPSTSASQSKNLAIKILSVGNQEVGKSCIIKRYCEGKFVKRYIPTIGVDYGVKKVHMMGFTVSVHFFDLSGCEDFKLIREEFYKNSQGCLMVFDVDDKESFKALTKWELEMRQCGADVGKLSTILLGNKCDLGSREVQPGEVSKWSKARNYNYYDTSATSGLNIHEAFDYLFQGCIKQVVENKKIYGV